MWLFISIFLSVNIVFTYVYFNPYWIGSDVFIGIVLIVEIIEHSIDYYFKKLKFYEK